MLKILYSRDFQKRFAQRIATNKKLLSRFYSRQELFRNNPRNPVLRNHALRGSREGVYAFSFAGDVRVIYKYYDSSTVIVLFIDIGSHN
jgi:mRNA-degrading endonuclease YafQ of YafQ-DinJ toxin-antitoxin module